MNSNKTKAHQLEQIAKHQLAHQSVPLKVWDAAIAYIPFNEMAKLVCNPKEYRFSEEGLE